MSKDQPAPPNSVRGMSSHASLTLDSQDPALLRTLGYTGEWRDGDLFQVGIDADFLDSTYGPDHPRQARDKARMVIEAVIADSDDPEETRLGEPPLLTRELTSEEALKLIAELLAVLKVDETLPVRAD